MSRLVERRAMTADEITMATALGFVRVLPATFDKRIVGELAACARDDVPAISERLALTLRRLVHKYRRQLKADVLALAGDRPPDPWTESVTVAAPDVSAPPPSREPTRVLPSTPQLSLL